MKTKNLRLLALAIILLCTTVQISAQIPYLKKDGSVTRLMVDGKPFLMLGGELGNSSATTMEYMQPIWPKLKVMNLNTVLVPVYWELMEPEQGKFDFTLLENLIIEARKNDLKIVFLWFGSWKNSMSSHTPAWVKLDQKKYPRVRDDKNQSQEILTPFSDNNLKADLNAFVALMKFLKNFDGNQHTVVMVQVENEIAMLPSARDFSPLANAAFKKDVPKDFIRYLKENKENLVPEFRAVWEKNGTKTSGNWEEIFGKGLHSDEIFMAWYFSEFTNKIAEAGKKVYSLPMYVNAALNRPGREPGSGYPSAGPLPHLMDVWKAAGTAIDFLAPDIYFGNFSHWADLYVRQGNPLFVPEHQFESNAAAKAIFAIGHYNALGFSPFSIESKEKPEDEPLGKIYRLIDQLAPKITAPNLKTEGVLLDKNYKDTVIVFGNYEFTCRHEYTLGWSAGAGNDEWPMAGAIIIQTGENEFWVAGSGVVITFKLSGNKTLNAGILKAEEGSFVNGQWKILRHLNGDQIHQGRHIRIPYGEYSIQRFSIYFYE